MPSLDVSAALVKAKFREAQPSADGRVDADLLVGTLVALGLERVIVERVVSAVGTDASGRVGLEDLVDWVFASGDDNDSARTRRIDSGAEVRAGTESTRSPGAPAASCYTPGGPPRSWSKSTACKPAPLRGLRRAVRVLRQGQAPGTARGLEAVEALDEFFATEIAEGLPPEEVQEEMRSLLAEASASRSPEAAERRQKFEEAPWERFGWWCVERVLLEAFKLCDLDADSRHSAKELIVLLLLISAQRGDSDARLDLADAQRIVLEFDATGDGMLSEAEFLNMLHSLEREEQQLEWDDESDLGHDVAATNHRYPSPRSVSKRGGGVGGRDFEAQRHLVLFFDVNNTVLVADSLAGADATDLLSMTLAGNAWGIQAQWRNGEETWIPICPEPRANPPWEGLSSYTEFVVQRHPMPEGKEPKAVEETKKLRRTALRTFCNAGQPGECFRPHMERLTEHLQRSGGRLLPSFYFLLLELKRAGRHFSVVFRTFGVDMDETVMNEFNAFCEGRLPICQGGPVLDGSDGLPDHRMDLRDPDSNGTFFRTADNDIALVWGTHEQPPRGKGLEFFEGIPGCRVHAGVAEASQSLQDRIFTSSRTIALRDYYPGWARANFAGVGGKPLFLRVEDDTVHHIFFDDHIRPVDPTIVDVIDVREYPKRLPFAQVYDAHLVKANPLQSIAELSYFWDELARCERAKNAQLTLRKKVARMLYDVAAVRRVISRLSGPVVEQSDLVRLASVEIGYERWKDKPTVRHATPLVGVS